MWMMPLHLHVNQKSDYDDMMMNLSILMDSSFWFDTINLDWDSPLYISRGVMLYF